MDFFKTTSNQDILLAKHLLEAGEVIGIPTETVYGLAANAFHSTAIEKIFAIKNRPSYNPLIIHVGNWEQLEEVALPFNYLLERITKKFWPGPLTVLCPKTKKISSLVTAGSDLVAVRMPNHPLTLKLLNTLSFPLVAPSANISNRISPTSVAHVLKYFDKKIPLVLDGGSCADGIESTIISVEKNQITIHRQGAISKESLESFGVDVVLKNNQVITSPGNFSKHYAPNIPMFLTDRPDLLYATVNHKNVGLLLYQPHKIFEDNAKKYFLSGINGDLKAAMKNLYHLLHTLEQDNIDLIIAELLPDFNEGSAINDRLKRASIKQFIFANNNIDLDEFTTFNG
jgi:L-threonylcarbamoyladenylate synthase